MANLRELLTGHTGIDLRAGLSAPAEASGASTLMLRRRRATKVVVVSACHSEEAGRAFVEAGVPHVVAVRLDSQVPTSPSCPSRTSRRPAQAPAATTGLLTIEIAHILWQVLDKAAMQFGRTFYENLLSGHTVRHAFETADRTVRASRSGHGLAIRGAGAAGPGGASEFLLLPDHPGAHDVSIFPAELSQEGGRSFVDEVRWCGGRLSCLLKCSNVDYFKWGLRGCLGFQPMPHTHVVCACACPGPRRSQRRQTAAIFHHDPSLDARCD